MRVFIGVDLSKEMKDYLFELERELRVLPAKIKFVDKKSLHITLKFLGEISEDKLEEIKIKLKEVKSKKFKIKLNDTGIFPGEHFIKIIWVGLEPAKDLIELHRKVDSELMEFKEEFEFKAHLTLGRVKLVKDKIKFLEIIKKVKIKPIEFEIDSFKLFSSVLSKDGPQYTVLENYILD